jgi:hypothetical protein
MKLQRSIKLCLETIHNRWNIVPKKLGQIVGTNYRQLAPNPQDLAVINLITYQTVGVLCDDIPSAKEPINSARSRACVMQASVSPSSWVLQEHGWRHFDPMQHPELIV